MPRITQHFVTSLYRAEIDRAGRNLLPELKAQMLGVAAEDRAGQAWCRDHGYNGYTSYASLAQITWHAPALEDLMRFVDRHARIFARRLEFDLGGRKLERDSLWINVLEPGGHHAAHIHPHSVISGTFYVDMSAGASAIRFEDPRHMSDDGRAATKIDRRQQSTHLRRRGAESGHVAAVGKLAPARGAGEQGQASASVRQLQLSLGMRRRASARQQTTCLFEATRERCEVGHCFGRRRHG